MKLVYALPILLFLFYMLTFAIHNWKDKNKIAAVGIVLIALSAAAYPLLFIFSFD
jgi:amino acid permease